MITMTVRVLERILEWGNKRNKVICLRIRESAVHFSQMYYNMSSVCSHLV